MKTKGKQIKGSFDVFVGNNLKRNKETERDQKQTTNVATFVQMYNPCWRSYWHDFYARSGCTVLGIDSILTISQIKKMLSTRIMFLSVQKYLCCTYLILVLLGDYHYRVNQQCEILICVGLDEVVSIGMWSELSRSIPPWWGE